MTELRLNSSLINLDIHYIIPYNFNCVVLDHLSPLDELRRHTNTLLSQISLIIPRDAKIVAQLIPRQSI